MIFKSFLFFPSIDNPNLYVRFVFVSLETLIEFPQIFTFVLGIRFVPFNITPAIKPIDLDYFEVSVTPFPHPWHDSMTNAMKGKSMINPIIMPIISLKTFSVLVILYCPIRFKS